jgi:GntR family transcriptional regulator
MTVNLRIEIDFRSGIPIYIQIMDQVKHMIATGELKPDDQLPTVRQLAADLRINFNTVARSYKLLDEAGIISTQQGRGTYILEEPSEENKQELRQKDLLRLTLYYLNEVNRLEYSPDEVNEIFQEKLAEWKSNGTLPEPDESD